MSPKSDPIHDVEFINQLKANQVKTPNDFIISMGELIRAAREEREISQAALAKETKRRPSTISAIEKGKSEIGVLTLVTFAIVLNKPISYFFPPSLLQDWIVDIKTPYEHKMLDIARELEHIGGARLSLDTMKLFLDYFSKEMNEEPDEEEDY